MDRRFLAHRNRRYDEPPPQWVALSPIISAPLIVTVNMARDGGWWMLPLVLSLVVWGCYFGAVARWDRKHRRPKGGEFDIAVDRQPS
jgi:hypothetical protein